MLRRDLITGFAAAAVMAVGLSASDPAQAETAGEIDAGVRAALDELFSRPGGEDLFNRASGVLIIPEVTKASFIVGGAYGEGALLVNGLTDSYWSYGSASIGLQLGGQKTRQALFFMTPQALAEFRVSEGFEAGADAEVTLIDDGAELAVDTTKDRNPIIAIVFDRKGLQGGASIQGGKYTRITR